MALNIKNEAVERLATELSRMTGETKTEAIRKALEERTTRLRMQSARTRAQRVASFLEREVWPLVPEEQVGHRLTRAEREAILGYGSEGV